MHKLLVHPSAHERAAGLVVSAGAELTGSILRLSYLIEEKALNQSRILWPTESNNSQLIGKGERQDELWKTTCLEAFLITLDGSYLEFNFSPKGLWNVYHFDSYRTGMRAEDRIEEVEFRSSQKMINKGSNYELTAEFDLSRAVKSPQHFRLGLAAVIETVSGEKSYWSLKHSGEKPDFHDSQSYLIELRT